MGAFSSQEELFIIPRIQNHLCFFRITKDILLIVVDNEQSAFELYHKITRLHRVKVISSFCSSVIVDARAKANNDSCLIFVCRGATIYEYLQ